MKYAFPLILAAFLVWGCNGRQEELEKQNAALQQQNRDLAQNITSQDGYIDEVVTSVNEVYQGIEAARASEKNLLNESRGIEGTKTQTKEEVRKDLIQRIAAVNQNLQENFKKVADLQRKVNTSRRQYSALQTMVDNLRKTLEEREQSIVALDMRVKGLEGEVAEKAELVRQREMVIDAQKKEIATVYYVVGTRKELEEKGIIQDEGGFLWGLIGATTTLAPGFDPTYFTPIDRARNTTFRVDRRIRDILPKRSPEYYTQQKHEGGESVLTVADLNHFWKDKYLVILTD
ncbi:MAG TPA: hypothetical protein VI932_06945 [Bacteroidota bacterium]|nr:hypothetical protein [Bacteroidota bacterium]